MEWEKAAARAAWWTSRAGWVMAADAVADQTELAEFGILGPLEVSRCDRAVPLGGPRQRAVLALLLLEPNRVVSLDRLAEDVWGGHPPEGWVTTVQIYVSHLRQALEPARARGAAGEILVTRNPGYLLRVDREQLDAARFQDGLPASVRDRNWDVSVGWRVRRCRRAWLSSLLSPDWCWLLRAGGRVKERAAPAWPMPRR